MSLLGLEFLNVFTVRGGISQSVFENCFYRILRKKSIENYGLFFKRIQIGFRWAR